MRISGLEDELPPDGKVDGFDRVGSSLYIDQSQLAKYFELADRVLSERVLAPKPKLTLPVKAFVRDMKWEPESQHGKFTKVDTMGPLAGILDKQEMLTFPTGATIYELRNGGIEYLCGGERISIGIHGSVSHGAGDGAGGGAWTNQINAFFLRATQEGKYRLRIRAGAFAGKGKFAVENVKLTFAFGKGGQQANLDNASVIVDAPLNKPRDYVIDVYLHPRPEVTGNNRATLTWNGIPAFAQTFTQRRIVQQGLILVAPEVYTLESELSMEHYRLASEEQRKHTPPARVTEILKSRFGEMENKRAACVNAYVAAKKPAFTYNPDYDLASIPRLFVES